MSFIPSREELEQRGAILTPDEQRLADELQAVDQDGSIALRLNRQILPEEKPEAPRSEIYLDGLIRQEIEKQRKPGIDLLR